MNRHNKRGQGISVNMMIIMVLAVVVLIIAILMLTKTARQGDGAINNVFVCPETNEGRCYAEACTDQQEEVYKTCSAGPNGEQRYCCKAI